MWWAKTNRRYICSVISFIGPTSRTYFCMCDRSYVKIILTLLHDCWQGRNFVTVFLHATHCHSNDRDDNYKARQKLILQFDSYHSYYHGILVLCIVMSHEHILTLQAKTINTVCGPWCCIHWNLTFKKHMDTPASKRRV